MKRWLQSCLPAILMLGLSVPGLWAQRKHPVTGREYAGVMGVGGAWWLERGEREAEERPELAVRLMEIKPGTSVADVGAGSGYYTELLSKAVGPEGRVYANDVQPGMIRILEQRIKKRKLSNVTAVEGRVDDARLPEGCCDTVVMVDVYHEFSEPQAMLRSVKAALKPGGRLILLEYRKEDAWIPIREEHKMSVAGVRAELEPEGFQFERVLPGLPWQHILIFRK